VTLQTLSKSVDEASNSKNSIELSACSVRQILRRRFKYFSYHISGTQQTVTNCWTVTPCQVVSGAEEPELLARSLLPVGVTKGMHFLTVGLSSFLMEE
jgi:hypothetical protein